MQTKENIIITNSLSALEAEIRRTRLSGRQHVVTEGIRCAADATHTFYRFSLRRPLECVDNAAVSLSFAGREFKGFIVQRFDRTVTVALEGALEGDIAQALLTADATELLRTTVKRLEELRAAPELYAEQLARAVRCIRGDASIVETTLPSLSPETRCTPSQREALQKIWGYDVGFLSGASGTGKTRTLAHLAAALMRGGRRVALVAPTNRGVDIILHEIEQILPAPASGAGVTAPIVRFGKRVDARRCGEADERTDYHQIVARATAALEGRIEGVNERLKEVRRALAETREKIQLYEARAELEKQLRAAKDEAKRASGGVVASALRFVSLSRSATVDGERSKLSAAIADLQARMRELNAKLKGVSLSDLTTWATELATREGQLVEHGWSCEQERAEIGGRIVEQAQITAMTPAHALSELPLLASFDAVLIDDATTIPIPNLLLLAIRARHKVVATGDARQLGPRSASDHPALARWYAADIISSAGIEAKLRTKEGLPYAAHLTEVFGKPPRLVKLLNLSTYDGELTSAAASPSPVVWPSALNCGGESEILLVDTAALQPSSIAVKRSKANLIHAILVTELCARLTRGEGAAEPGEIAVIAPYRPHLDLLHGLLREASLRDVAVSPVSDLCGERRPFVILDLSESPPLTLGGFASASDAHHETARLVAQALSTSCERLIVVGNMHFLRTRLPDPHPLQGLLDGLDMHAEYLDAAAWLASEPTGSASRAESPRLLSPQQWGAAFVNDLKRARAEILLHVTDISERRVSLLLPLLRRKLREGVNIRVVLASDLGRLFSGGRYQPDWMALLASEGISTERGANLPLNVVCIDRDGISLGTCSPLTHVVRSDASLLVVRTRAGAQLVADYLVKGDIPTAAGEYRPPHDDEERSEMNDEPQAATAFA